VQFTDNRHKRISKILIRFSGVQEVRQDKVALSHQVIVHFSMKMGVRSMSHEFVVHTELMSAVKRVDSVSDGMSYIILQDWWCNIIVLREVREV
jgi:hypothetical protein